MGVPGVHPVVVTIASYQIDNLLALIQAVGDKSDQAATPARLGGRGQGGDLGRSIVR